ncbi:MAG TPA: hypothetical protein VLA19_05220 [Herpetosiphonaceae bacterium]|nr:hypothetical protein [Herpetosiphonaceae bacterium]
MSDRPLFPNTDEQEAVYAPQESADPEETNRALVEEGTLSENRAGTGGGDDAGNTVIPLPGPGGAGAGTGGAMGDASGSTRTGLTRFDDDNDNGS